MNFRDNLKTWVSQRFPHSPYSSPFLFPPFVYATSPSRFCWLHNHCRPQSNTCCVLHLHIVSCTRDTILPFSRQPEAYCVCYATYPFRQSSRINIDLLYLPVCISLTFIVWTLHILTWWLESWTQPLRCSASVTFFGLARA